MAMEAYEKTLAAAKARSRALPARARYIPAADCVRFIGKNRAYNGERIDTYLTLYLDRRTGEPIGFKLKCFRTLVTELQKRGYSTDSPFTFGEVLDVVSELAEATEQARKQRDRARQSDLADVQILA